MMKKGLMTFVSINFILNIYTYTYRSNKVEFPIWKIERILQMNKEGNRLYAVVIPQSSNTSVLQQP